MTVAELITYLQTQPQDLEVLVMGYEGGYDSINPANIRKIATRPNDSTRWYDGKFSAVDDPDLWFKPNAIVLSR